MKISGEKKLEYQISGQKQDAIDLNIKVDAIPTEKSERENYIKGKIEEALSAKNLEVSATTMTELVAAYLKTHP